MEWLKIIGISIAMILIGYIVLRIIAKRSFSEMSPFNIFLIIMLSHILSEPIRTDNVTELIIPTVIIVGAFLLYSYLMNSNKIGKAMKNDSVVLIRHGNIDEKALNKAKMSISEMLSELRVKGYSRTADVEFAILEETGKLSIIPNAAKRPVTTTDLSIVTGYEGLPVPVVIDGAIQYDNLAKIDFSLEQLITRIKMQGYTEEMIKTISLAILDEKKNVIIDQNDDTNQGNLTEDKQGILQKVKEDLKASSKSPEGKDLGLVDDNIKP